MKKVSLLFAALLLAVSFAFAQFTPVAGGLLKPIGVQIDDTGNAWVAESGTGNNDARITIVKPGGDKIPVITGLPSFTDAAVGETSGAYRSVFLPNNQVAVIVGGGPTALFGRIMYFNFTGFVPGTSAAKTIKDTTKTVDISGYVFPLFMDSDPFSFVSDAAGNLFVVDAGGNCIVKITPDGKKSIFITFPDYANPTPIGAPTVQFVPTKILNKPGGGFYVSNLTGFPFLNGKAAVYIVDTAGKYTPYATGLSLITDLALDEKTGDLYAMQFGSFAFAPQPGYVFGSGKVWRIRPGGKQIDSVAGNFGPGAGMAFDKQGNLYVTSLFTSQLLKMNNVTRCNNFGLSLTADNNNVLKVNNYVKYSLTVTNNSTVNATNVRVFWLPPYKRFEGDKKPFAFTGAYASKGYYDSWNGYWSIENLAPGESATANFHLYVVDDKLDVTQTAQVASCNEGKFIFSAQNGDNESVSALQTTLVTKANPITNSIANQNNMGLSVSPNPANTKINISIDAKTDGNWTLKMINALGQTVYNKSGQSAVNLDVNVSEFPNGMYFVEHQIGTDKKIEKVLVQH